MERDQVLTRLAETLDLAMPEAVLPLKFLFMEAAIFLFT